MHPRIVGSILRNINLWFHTTEHSEHERISKSIHPHIDTSTIGDLISKAEREQEEIGWGNFLCGRLSKKWSEAQNVHNHRLKQLDPDTKTIPTSSLIKQLWSVRLALWRNRNEKKHGGTQEEREKNHQKKLYPRIIQAYEDQYTGLVPGARRSVFKISKATRLGSRAATDER